MNGLFYTTPLPALMKRLEDTNCTVIPGGKIDQTDGIRTAIRLGYRNIAVTVNGYRGETLSEIRDLERTCNVSVTMLVVCNTGVGKKRISEIREHADLVWCCGSNDIRNTIGRRAILQMSLIMPVFVLTVKGINLACSYFPGYAMATKIDTGKQYLVSQVPGGEETRAGAFRAYLCEARLPVRSEKEPVETAFHKCGKTVKFM